MNETFTGTTVIGGFNPSCSFFMKNEEKMGQKQVFLG
jgi:hypothetical protein